MVNCDGVGTDRFMPLKFEIRTHEGTVDMYEEAFGKRPTNPFLNSSSSTLDDVRQSIESIQSRDVRAEWDASKYHFVSHIINLTPPRCYSRELNVT